MIAVPYSKVTKLSLINYTTDYLATLRILLDAKFGPLFHEENIKKVSCLFLFFENSPKRLSTYFSDLNKLVRKYLLGNGDGGVQ